MKNTIKSHGLKMMTFILLFVGLCVYFRIIPNRISSLCDDAFISFNYAKHFEQGAGLVFNPGERIEGYTNFLWTLLLAAGPRLGVAIPRFALAVSVLSAAFLVVAVLIFSISYFHHLPHPYVSYVSSLLLAMNPVFLQHLRTGLETTFFTLLTFLSFAAWLKCRQNPRYAYVTGLVLGLAYLTRPEAVLWAGTFVAVDIMWVLMRREKASECFSSVTKYGFGFALIVMLHIAWRLSYYGEWLPNTFYVKAADNWFWGIKHTKEFLWSTGFLPVVAACAGPLVLRKKWAAGISAVTGILLFYNLRMGGDHIFTGRFLIPLLPLTFIMIQELTRSAFSYWEGHPSIPFIKKRVLQLLPLVFLFLYIFGAVREWPRARKMMVETQQQTAFNRWVASTIETQTRPTDTIAIVPAGVIPYYAERTFIDMLGLNDSYIAHNGTIDRKCLIGHQKTDTDYILDRKPEFIAIPIKAKASRLIAAEYYMYKNPRFLKLYRLVELPSDVRPFRIFARKDLF